MPDKSHFENLVEKGERLAKSSIELLRLKSIDKSTDVLAAISMVATIGCLVVLFIIMGSIGIAMLVGEWLNRGSLGFIIVATFYALVALILYTFRRRLIVNPLKNLLIKVFDKEIDHDEQE